MNRIQSEPTIEQCIQAWQRKLIDFTRRNRLLYFRRSRSSNLAISEPDAQTVFSRLVVQENPWEFWLPPLEGESPRSRRRNEIRYDVNDRMELERILRNLYRRSNAYYQERGVRVLYVAFGMLNWREREIEAETSGMNSAPLILCPVKLTRESARKPFLLQLAEEGPVLNPSLQARLLQRDFEIQLPDEMLEDPEQLLISDYLNSISNFVQPLGWNVEPTVLIGLFSFYKLVMHKDLKEKELRVRENPLIQAICHRQPNGYP